MMSNNAAPSNIDEKEDPEGLDLRSSSWGSYPLDEILIRNETRTIQDVIRRIDSDRYVMNPDFQRDFIWPEDKQSKLIESVIMRIPLPVFYMAEDEEGRLVVVDGLQRLSTFSRFVKDELKLRLPDRQELNGKKFSDLDSKLQNRTEDCNLVFYVIDSKVPERARLDIFERVNGGVALTRQQMRNCLFMGEATKFLKDESRTTLFLEATGNSLDKKSMRDREFVNRFCAFQVFGPDKYQGDMDKFLARTLQKMNKMGQCELRALASQFHQGLENNLELHGHHAFRKHRLAQERRSVLNASFWDVMSTGLSHYSKDAVEESAENLHFEILELLENDEFDAAISISTNDTKRVKMRFKMANDAIGRILGAHQT